MDQDLLRHLGNPAFHGHVPEIHDFGQFVTSHGEVAWVAMEYLPTTLSQLIEQEAGGRRLPKGRAKDLLAGLAAALDFWQRTVDRNPLDSSRTTSWSGRERTDSS
jgi:hypothetical protein